LRKGDFLELFKNENLPDLIFYDPFSIHTDSKLWTEETFRKLFSNCKSKPMKLMTYSASTLVRARLLAAGFWVGRGTGTGPKAETTVAYTDSREAIQSGQLLSSDWLKKYERSQAKAPENFTPNERLDFEKRVLSHPQFKS
jgi:queuine tRNA-ribosyltransferase